MMEASDTATADLIPLSVVTELLEKSTFKLENKLR